MTAERVTQCPHCKATFKVSDEQLAVAKGRVRCGACMNVFDALAYSDIEPESFNAGHQDQFTNENPADLEQELIQDHPEEDEEDPNYSNMDFTDEFSTEFLSLDEHSVEKDPYKTDIREADSFDQASDDRWAADILEEELSGDSRKEPKIGDDFSDFDGNFDEPAVQKRSMTLDPGNLDDSGAGSDNRKSGAIETLSFQYDQDEKKSARHWIFTGCLAIFNIALLLALLAQAGWFFYDKIAKYPQAVTFYSKVCQHLQCTLPTLEDISLIQSENLIVRSHPTQPDALVIDVIIENKADYEQAFPDMALFFSDINGKTIAQRLIQPNEYLSDEARNLIKMPSQKPIHISLELVDPGKSAVNYELELFPSKTNTQDSSQTNDSAVEKPSSDEASTTIKTKTT